MHSNGPTGDEELKTDSVVSVAEEQVVAVSSPPWVQNHLWHVQGERGLGAVGWVWQSGVLHRALAEVHPR